MGESSFGGLPRYLPILHVAQRSWKLGPSVVVQRRAVVIRFFLRLIMDLSGGTTLERLTTTNGLRRRTRRTRLNRFPPLEIYNVPLPLD